MKKAHPVLNCLKKRDKRYPKTKISNPFVRVETRNRNGPKPAYDCGGRGLSRETITDKSQARPNRISASIISFRRAALGDLFSFSSPTALRLTFLIQTVLSKGNQEYISEAV